MSKWQVSRDGPQWLMSEEGQVVGYRDERGAEFLIPQIKVNEGDSAQRTAPESAVSGGGNALLKRLMATAPGPGGIPKVMASPYSVAVSTVSAANQTATASAITNAVHVRPTAPGCFTILGRASIGTPIGGSVEALTTYGASTGPQQSPAPYAVEYVVDTAGGAFDVVGKDNGALSHCRIAVNGQYLSAGYTAVSIASSGSPLLIAVSGLPAGRHVVRVECSPYFNFGGINIGPTDSVRKTATPPLTVSVVADSFGEPTITDSTSGYMLWGFPQHLGQMLGANVLGSGSGGTGYLNPGSGGRVKFRDRLAVDVLAVSPNVVIWAGGINDYAYGSYTKAGLQAEAAACYAAVAAALPLCQQIVLSPFFGRGYQSFPSGLLEARDAIKAAAVSAGIPFVDVLEAPQDNSTQVDGIFASASTAGATSVSSSVSVRDGTVIRLGSSGVAEIRSVSSSSGSGPYTLTLTAAEGALVNNHAAGEPIAISGRAWVTGTGRQGATAGNGSADRYTGNDSTHPTSDMPAVGGHPALAASIFSGLIRTLVV